MNVFWTTLRLTADLFMKLYWYSVYMIFTRFMRYFEDMFIRYYGKDCYSTASKMFLALWRPAAHHGGTFISCQ